MVVLDAISQNLVSIESATLELSSPGVRHIYGNIHINGYMNGRALSVYKRSAADPDTSSSDQLTLCGPLVHVLSEDPTYLYVNLHDQLQGPLIEEKVHIVLDFVRLEKPNIPVEIVATGKDCVLKVCMISLAPSVIATTELLFLDELPLDKWLVSGKVSAVQKSNFNGRYQERTFPLFSRPESSPVRVLPNGGIPLDRDVVVAPMKMDLHRVRELVKSVPGAPRPDDPIFGQDSSIDIDVDLNLVMDGGDGCVLSAVPHFVVNGTHQLGTTYEQYVVGAVGPPSRRRLKRKGNVNVTMGEKLYCVSRNVKLKSNRREEIESFVTHDHILTLKVSLTPLDNRFPNMDTAIDKEDQEEDLPLYTSPENDPNNVPIPDGVFTRIRSMDN